MYEVLAKVQTFNETNIYGTEYVFLKYEDRKDSCNPRILFLRGTERHR